MEPNEVTYEHKEQFDKACGMPMSPTGSCSNPPKYYFVRESNMSDLLLYHIDYIGGMVCEEHSHIPRKSAGLVHMESIQGDVDEYDSSERFKEILKEKGL